MQICDKEVFNDGDDDDLIPPECWWQLQTQFSSVHRVRCPPLDTDGCDGGNKKLSLRIMDTLARYGIKSLYNINFQIKTTCILTCMMSRYSLHLQHCTSLGQERSGGDQQEQLRRGWRCRGQCGLASTSLDLRRAGAGAGVRGAARRNISSFMRRGVSAWRASVATARPQHQPA